MKKGKGGKRETWIDGMIMSRGKGKRKRKKNEKVDREGEGKGKRDKKGEHEMAE